MTSELIWTDRVQQSLDAAGSGQHDKGDGRVGGEVRRFEEEPQVRGAAEEERGRAPQ